LRADEVVADRRVVLATFGTRAVSENSLEAGERLADEGAAGIPDPGRDAGKLPTVGPDRVRERVPPTTSDRSDPAMLVAVSPGKVRNLSSDRGSSVPMVPPRRLAAAESDSPNTTPRCPDHVSARLRPESSSYKSAARPSGAMRAAPLPLRGMHHAAHSTAPSCARKAGGRPPASELKHLPPEIEPVRIGRARRERGRESKLRGRSRQPLEASCLDLDLTCAHRLAQSRQPREPGHAIRR
jgi:hypothetical protein